MANSEGFNPEKTGLVVIDLQNSVVQLEGAPYTAAQVVDKAVKLVSAFRERGLFVGLVRVASKDGKDMLSPRVETPRRFSGGGVSNPSDIVPEIGLTDTDHLITKHQWGAFYGTDLDLQLRRRGIDTIVLCGIATGYGVDTTAREAYQHGYNQVFAIDAMTGLALEEHEYVMKYIFPRIGLSRTTQEILRQVQG